MPNHKSAEKRMRQSENRRAINRSNRTRVRTQIKKLHTALTAGNKSASELLPATISVIDKAVQKGVLHKNAAARHKSRLTASMNQASAKTRFVPRSGVLVQHAFLHRFVDDRNRCRQKFARTLV